MPPSFTDEGISTAAELRRCYPEVGILVLSTYAETSYASQLLISGSRLSKDSATVADPDSPRVAEETVVTAMSRLPRTDDGKIRAEQREREVLSHMAEGRSNLGIAKELFLSARTVAQAAQHVFHDTDVKVDSALLHIQRLAAAIRYTEGLPGPATFVYGVRPVHFLPACGGLCAASLESPAKKGISRLTRTIPTLGPRPRARRGAGYGPGPARRAG